MRYFNPFLFFLMAAVAIYIGITAKNFYPGKLGKKTTTGKWFGRSWFFIFAVIAIYMGIRSIR